MASKENEAISQTGNYLSAGFAHSGRPPRRAQSMRCPRIKRADDLLDTENTGAVKLMPLARNSSVRRSRQSDEEITTGLDPTFYTHFPSAKSDDSAIFSDQADEMQRMRTFQVNAKGVIVDRGKSMRRRGNSESRQRTSVGGIAPPKSPNAAAAATSPSADFKQSCQKFNFDLHPTDVPSAGFQKCDIIIIGSAQVGKGSILKQLVSSSSVFGRDLDVNYNDQQQNPTVVVSVNKEEFDVTFFAVDPNKNDLWQSLCASGYVVVFAVDDSDSFKCARECIYKLRDSKFSENVPIILAANKIDLERKRNVSNDDAKTLAKSNGCKFVELSTVLGHNVDELLVALLTKIKKQTTSSPSTNRSVMNRADSNRAALSYRSSNPATDLDNGTENSDADGNRNRIFRRSFRKSRHHHDHRDDNEPSSSSHTPSLSRSPSAHPSKTKLTATKSAQPRITVTGQNKNDQDKLVHHFGEASRQFLRKIFSGKRVQSRSAEDVSNG